MEFFSKTTHPLTAEQIQTEITGPRLAEFCASIDRVLNWDIKTDSGEMYCLWGQFRVNRETLKHGVRFSLPECPNALAWTITAEPHATVIHCTINQQEHDPDFIASIETFVVDWSDGIKQPPA
jgi:hypothetical protein